MMMLECHLLKFFICTSYYYFLLLIKLHDKTIQNEIVIREKLVIHYFNTQFNIY